MAEAGGVLHPGGPVIQYFLKIRAVIALFWRRAAKIKVKLGIPNLARSLLMFAKPLAGVF